MATAPEAVKKSLWDLIILRNSEAFLHNADVKLGSTLCSEQMT